MKSFTSTFVLLSAVILSACSHIDIAQTAGDGAGAIDAPPPLPVATTQQFQAALEMIKEENYQQAETLLERIIASQPQLAGPYLNLGMVYANTGRDPMAKRAFARVIEINPENAAAYNELGIIYRKEGDFEKARLAYQQALMLAPDYALAHRNIGILFDLYLRQPARALPHYQRYQALLETDDRQVELWIVELTKRVESTPRIASTRP